MSRFINLEGLDLENNSLLHGSFKLLAGMIKLKWLRIHNTDIDSGLGYLLGGIEYFSYSPEKNAKVKAIYDLFKNEKGEVETDYNDNNKRQAIKNFPQKKQKLYNQQAQILHQPPFGAPSSSNWKSLHPSVSWKILEFNDEFKEFNEKIVQVQNQKKDIISNLAKDLKDLNLPYELYF